MTLVRTLGAELGPALSGQVIGPDDPGYAASVAAWELSVVHRPPAVVRAGALDDIDATVRWAAAHEVPVAVQCTGHGAVRPIDEGILLDVGALVGVAVDGAQRTATIAGGSRWRDVIPSIADAGLTGVQGSSSGVGVAGYTLAGGMGPIGRFTGFAADHVREVEIVLPDGERVTASADRDPELFFGVRGGGGNFGVARSITVDLLPLTTVFGGGLYVAAEHAAEVFAAWRAWLPQLDERTSTSIAFLSLPDVPMLEPAIRGRHVVHVRVAHVPADAASIAREGDALVAPLRASAPVLLDTLQVMALRDSDRIHRDPVPPAATSHRGQLVETLDDGLADTILAIGTDPSLRGLRLVELRRMGGALARPAAVPNAVSGRSDGFHLYTTAVSTGDLAAAQAAETAVVAALAPWEAPTAQLNFRGPVPDAPAVLACWDAETAARLSRLKAAVDPRGLFDAGQGFGPWTVSRGEPGSAAAPTVAT